MRRALAIAPVAALVIAVSALAAGCGDDDDSDSATTTSTAASADPIYREPGTTISASSGETFVIELTANPGTGYTWELAESLDEAVVRSAGSEFVAPGTDRVGAAGTERLRFEAAGAGSATIALRYVRPWEAADADEATVERFPVEVS